MHSDWMQRVKWKIGCHNRDKNDETLKTDDINARRY